MPYYRSFENAGEMMHSWLQDLRYAWRMLRKNTMLSLIILASLAIGIGANSAIFSVVYAVLLRPLPYPHADRLATVWLNSLRIGVLRDWLSPGQYVDIQNENHSFETMALAQSRSFTLMGREHPERIDGLRTQSSLLKMLGAKPLLGRLLLPEEDQPGKAAVAILSNPLWRRLFNSDPAIVGKTITLDGNPFIVAGVLQSEFMLNTEVLPSERPLDELEIFVPLPLGADAVKNRGDENYNVVVRLKRDTSIQQAQADIDVIASRIREKDKRDRSFGMHIVGLRQQVVGDVQRPLLVLLGSVALVLLIACANIASLLLTRAIAREKEVAIRVALGATSPRLARQLLSESVLIATLGGAAGLVVAQASLYLVRAMNPGNIPRLGEIAINGSVLAFTFGLSLVTGILFGMAPLWRAVGIEPNISLKASGRSRSLGGLYLRRHKLHGLLVVSELAFSQMLLIGAGLLIQSFVRLQRVDPGFTRDHVLTMQILASDPKYRDPRATANLLREIDTRIAHLTDVLAEGTVSSLPLSSDMSWGVIEVEGYVSPPGQEILADLRIASADYFRTMQIPLRTGRFFSEHDTAEMPKVTIIDEKFAQRFWPQGNAVGKHLRVNMQPTTIVGIVGAVKHYRLETESKITAYFPEQQYPVPAMFLAIRTSSDPGGLSAATVHEIHSLDPSVLVFGVRTMRDRLHDSLARQRFSTILLGAFAAFALLLAALGLYGVIAHLVTQSTHDIALLMALGAMPGNIVGLVVRQGMELTAIGILVGIAVAAALTRVMASLLFGIGTTDAATFATVPVLLAGVALTATILPAWRATGVEPVVALREE
jgi:predicted permease